VRDTDAERREGEIDDETGVAVVFDENEDEDEGEDEGGFEIQDQSSDEEEEDAEDDATAMEEKAQGAGGDEGMEDDALVIGGEGAQGASKRVGDKGRPSAREIDGFWLQRLVATQYPDAQEAATKAKQAFDYLASDSNTRDLENQLMELFDWSNFQVVQTLTKNRELIVWCTKLARSTDDERVNVEVAMREKGAGWILKELSGSISSSKPAVGADDMDVDAKPTVPTKANIAPGSLVVPRKAVDLEAMTFSQGSRLMSNKKVKLPEGSFKRAKKGYEEVHVPAPKPIPVKQGELVKISDLPEWAQAAFKVPTLNRIQSRLYPVAFNSPDEEPMLVCAPTGAGKVRFPPV
jgi:pre-mRNA-splicing helicase BRR2